MAASTKARREVIPAGREPWKSAAAVLLAETGCTVRRWRSARTGTAWTKSDDWGIEVPSPSTPVRFAVFAHEVGHQLLHRGNSLPRWEEEFQAWEYALDQFARFELPGQSDAAKFALRCCAYATAKALRRARRDDTRAAVDARYSAFAGRWAS